MQLTFCAIKNKDSLRELKMLSICYKNHIRYSAGNDYMPVDSFNIHVVTEIYNFYQIIFYPRSTN